jgi:tRNA wybutosine-synthesizing protein 1
MKDKSARRELEKQGYRFVNNSGAVKICRWTKKDLLDKGKCYKSVFYGINSYSCCQMSPWVACQNKCLHCWRAIELNMNKFIDKEKIDKPDEIIDGCIKQQRKLLSGFKGNSKVNQKKLKHAQEPMQFAISLSGEPTIYPYIGELIEELKKRGKTSFLVTNGLHPEKLQELIDKKQFPTQLYVSVNIPFEKDYQKFHRSSKKDAWKRLNKSLSLMNKFPRSVFRMNLIREINMSDENVKEFAKLIKKYNPLFVELKGFMSVGFARERLGYDKMPNDLEMKNFSEKLVKELGEEWKILNSHEYSRAFLVGRKKDKKRMKII